MLHKVSIVVPIYKVEKYLERCIISIVEQSYGNIEIILVNDGSPDNCGTICEQYAKEDHRIKVIKKKNGGLSDARNYGMQSVTGKYTIFVDSDDWIDTNMVEDMISCSIKYQADIVQTSFYYAYDDYLLFDNRYYADNAPEVVIKNKNKLMSELIINERVKNFAWGKLFRTNLIRNIPFEKGVLFEDVFWAYQVMHLAKTYVLLHQPGYYYYQRDDSIVSTYTPKNLDMIRGLKERHFFIERFYTDLIDESYKVIFMNSLSHYHLLLINRKKDKDGLHKKDIRLYINHNYKKLKKAVERDGHLKKQLLLFHVHPYLNILYLLTSRVLRKFKIIPQPAKLQRINF